MSAIGDSIAWVFCFVKTEAQQGYVRTAVLSLSWQLDMWWLENRHHERHWS
jgi:hypothetical protein